MRLSPDDGNLFFSNFLGLLSYVNDKYNLIPNFGHPKSPEGLPFENVITLKDKLWGDVTIIDEYIDSLENVPEEHIQILKGWKKKFQDNSSFLNT
ncbi:MAG: hypothetical protein LBC74_06895 [Planctomycetaceae bacterium]|jgi:hypothetical protein|nr:hypothetical protein [Planctomycetaceae bacterium]